MLRKVKSREGFTLVELLIVIVILGILIGIGFMRFAAVQDAANRSADDADLRVLTSAAQLFAMEETRFLDDDEWAWIDSDNSVPDDLEDYVDIDEAEFPRFYAEWEWDGNRFTGVEEDSGGE